MFKNERQELILEMLQKNPYLTTREIAEKVFCSYSSTRRDLEELEQEGMILRSYGKVELANRHPMLISYPLRIEKNSEEKRIMAKKAVSLIRPGDTIFVDPSSSSSYFIKELTDIKSITIVTNNVEALFYLTQHNVNVICSGGMQTEPNRYALVGSACENTFSGIHADWCVFSCRSLTKDGRLYDIHYNETIVRNVMLKNAEKKIFLCDSTKLNTISTYYQCSLADIDYLVSDSPEAKKYKKLFHHISVI